MRQVFPEKSIGSFFESISSDLELVSSTPPWHANTPIQYLQSGRQALRYLSQFLSDQGRSTVLLPDFICESVVSSFDATRWSISTYALTKDFKIDFDSLRSVLSHPEETVILTMAYFGELPNNRHKDFVYQLQSLGVVVVEDETHRTLSPFQHIGDFGVASLRKLLPVADGAYLRGRLPLVKAEADLEVSNDGWLAMDLKRDGSYHQARHLNRATEDRIDIQFTPRLPSLRSIDTIHLLNYEELRIRRKTNAAFLRSEIQLLSSFEAVGGSEVPSHLVLQTKKPRILQTALAARGIFCPIHWPQPRQWRGKPWRDDLISIPIDHRYDIGDMSRVVRALKETDKEC